MKLKKLFGCFSNQKNKQTLSYSTICPKYSLPDIKQELEKEGLLDEEDLELVIDEETYKNLKTVKSLDEISQEFLKDKTKAPETSSKKSDKTLNRSLKEETNPILRVEETLNHSKPFLYLDNSSIQENTNKVNFIGPLLKFHDILNGYYYGTILIILNKVDYNKEVFVTVTDGEYEQRIQGVVIDEFIEKCFIRFELKIRMHDTESKKIQYEIFGQQFEFHIQAKNQNFNFAFFSCNGFSSDVDPLKLGGSEPLWLDLLNKHSKKPFHCMIGGGDQLYCDDVFKLPELKSWLKALNQDSKSKLPFNSNMEKAVSNFYFNYYCFTFGKEFSKFGVACSKIPYTMVIDDHDIFDGRGSYPKVLEECDTFIGIKKIALRFFLLFQHHTTKDLAKIDGYFGVQSYSWLKNFGPDVAVLGLDNRFERKITQMMSKESYEIMFEKLKSLSSETKHLIIVLGIPIIYPRLHFLEVQLKALFNFETKHKKITRFFSKHYSQFGEIINIFGQPELLDDLYDHWTADGHIKERTHFIKNLQLISKAKNLRITFLSGDVHCGGAGYLKSIDNEIGGSVDHRFMVQIISSGIVNAPPPDIAIKALHQNSRTYRFDPYTIEQMIPLFSRDVNGHKLKNKKLLNRRNYATLQSTHDHSLNVKLNMENINHIGTKPYELLIPPLVKN